MKQLIIIVVALLTLFYAGCSESKNHIKTIDYHEQLASFLNTKATDPLNGTVWMATSPDEFKRMLLFKDNVVHLFYGLIEGDEMQRWSDYYSAPYELSEDGLSATTFIVYPIFGEKELTQTLTIVKAEKDFTITSELDTYWFVGPYTSDLDERWTLVFTTIQPWGE